MCSMGAAKLPDGKEGVEPQSETVWRQADKWRRSICHQDGQAGRELLPSVDTIKEKLGATPIEDAAADVVPGERLHWRCRPG